MQQKYNICSWMLTRFVSAFFENRILLSELLNEILDLLKTAVQTILSEKNMNRGKNFLMYIKRNNLPFHPLSFRFLYVFCR